MWYPSWPVKTYVIRTCSQCSLTFYLSLYLTSIQISILALYLTYSYFGIHLTHILASYLTFYLAIQVRRCPLRSELRPLRSGDAHCKWELVVEVLQCPLQLGAGSWSPAAPWRLRSGDADCDHELADGAGSPSMPTTISRAGKDDEEEKSRMLSC